VIDIRTCGAGDCSYRIGIYVRESRDDNEENSDTLETQRELLMDYASKNGLGSVRAVYEDDNISGSAFERPGLDRLKSDVLAGRVDLLLLKDLSRLGRNNAKTLLFIDFLEENGVRIVTFDGRYDSIRDDETAGLETWVNERYVRDISRKIRASLRFKIGRGEYLGHAPFGYVKQTPGENRLYVDEGTAPVVRLIYRLYRSGLGYSSIAGLLNNRDLAAPGSGRWNSVAVRRILCSRVYTGDTVQGVSEKVSFKSKKTRRIPEEKWVVTENTHEPIISREEFAEIQAIRLGKGRANAPHKKVIHPLRGLLYCGCCGSIMYSRKKKNGGTAYVCSNYYRNGSKACSSHFVNEADILGFIAAELSSAFRTPSLAAALSELSAARGLFGGDSGDRAGRNKRQLALRLRQQELLYSDRLEGRITEQLFTRMNRQLEAKICGLRQEAEKLAAESAEGNRMEACVKAVLARLESGIPDNAAIREAVDAITVYDPGDIRPESVPEALADHAGIRAKGLIVIDFKSKKV
jgi:site-specific DNA recombinase